MSHFVLEPGDVDTLKYIITHVFCPLQLPNGDDHSIQKDHSLARAIATAAHLYTGHVDDGHVSRWNSISRMLENLRATFQSESLDELQTISQFSNMDVGDSLAFLIRAQNAGVIFRKQKDVTIFESFEVSPKAKDVMTTEGKLICSYPGPAIAVPNLVFNDKHFISELANFLVHMSNDDLDDLDSVTERSSVFKDTVHPRYITELLTGILRSVGHPADIPRIGKRIGDDVVCNDPKLRPWRRSSLWLLTRVALQTTLGRSPLGNEIYKEFMLSFMCCLAEEKTCTDLPSDLLHFMSAKISRRLRKLGSSAPDWLSRTAFETCSSLRATIENRWKQVQTSQCISPPWTPSQLDLTRDIQLSLEFSGDYLHNSLLNQSVQHPHIPFNFEPPPRASLDDLLSSHGDLFKRNYCVEPHIALWDVERGVEQSIDTWVSRVTDNAGACVKLESLAYKYSSSASETYKNNPELLSVMLLTTIELWVALDRIAVKEIPILADYSPEVPTSLLENLLLCKAPGLNRLHRVHEYLTRRHSQSRSRWSVFSPTTNVDSFSVRFYRKSSYLRQLKSRIEEDATREAQHKFAELQQKNTRFAESRRPKSGVLYVGEIDVYEWPLPADQLEAEAVVFELDCPVPYEMWRTATLHLLVDLCSPSIQQQSRGPRIPLSDYTPLKPYFFKHPKSRVTLGSDSRSPFFSYPKLRIPANEEQVCGVKNALTFFAFDMQTNIPVSRASERSDDKRHYTYQLQSGSYHNLQKYVDSTSHTPNEVIANQAECHKDLSIHEYMAFGHLRSGGLLQWLNILREIHGRSMTFRRQEVHMLLAQAVLQVGPFGRSGLTWHQEIQQPTFCYTLLGELRSLAKDVKANWLEAVTMDTISFLLRRLLASRPDRAVSTEILNLLRTVRGIVFSWLQELSARLIKTPEDEGFRRALRDAAAICRSTFDVDPALVPDVLHSAEDVEVLLTSTIIIHSRTPSDATRLPTYSRLLIERNRRLSLAFEGILSNAVRVDNDEGISLAVRRIWPDFHLGSKWFPLQTLSSHWFLSTSATSAGQRPREIRLNIFDGSLLVDGKPLGTWLPKEYVQHPLYNLIFGDQIEALPSNLPGMDYSAMDIISGHQVHFSLRNNDADLVIRARRKQTDTSDSPILELIPHDKFEGDLPRALIEGHVHWLDLSTSVIEIRPHDSLWEASSKNWMLDCTPGHYRMWKGHERLVDIRSQSWNMVSGLLKPLSSPQDLILSVSPLDVDKPTSLQLSVVLPYYDLSFYVDEDGDLQSHNMRGLVYDENQSIGTLFGLVNRLVLRSKIRDTNAIELVPRCVLIPDGAISFWRDDHHVHVEIIPFRSRVKRVAYQAYRVNSELGCLIGNGSLTSKLYCAYLHALTSGCSADPLTGRSGTEEGLSVLQSASCWSTVKFYSRDAELLSLIASVCPLRTWLLQQPIQKVEWGTVPTHLQNVDICILSKAIKEYHERVLQLHESRSSPSLFQGFPIDDDHLLKRSARRAAYLFPTSEKSSEANFDVQYITRDIMEIPSREHNAFIAAACVYSRTGMSTMDLCRMARPWTEDMPVWTHLSLRYDRSWLAPDLPLTWVRTYNLLRESNEEKWFQMLFSLPAMAYASQDLSEFVPMFVAFASCPQFRREDPPGESIPISKGCYPSFITLHDYVIDCAFPLIPSPEGPKLIVYCRYDELSDDRYHDVELEMYESKRRSDANATAQRVLDAWPCETPPSLTLNPNLYDIADLEFKVQSYVSDCYCNYKFQEHLTCVQIILDNLRPQAPQAPDTPLYAFYPLRSIPRTPQPLTLLDQLFNRPALSLRARDRLPWHTIDAGNTQHTDSDHLCKLIAIVEENSETVFQHQYISALRGSAERLRSEKSLAARETAKRPSLETLLKHYVSCRYSYFQALSDLQQHLSSRSQSEQAIEQSGQWPRITAHTLFGLLASNGPIVLSDGWKKCLIHFTLLALELQRARRLLLLSIDGLDEEFCAELSNEGCDGWDAESHPDWLLIQLQGNFLIRRVQAEVANEMILPCSGDNTAMQLNMGAGKTSVIVPIVAADLANGHQLVRVIVPKPLATQTLHLLVDRLGGLTNRRIYYLPFSRSGRINYENASFLRQITLKCMQEHGILVLLPEHILSLKLMSVEKQLSRAEDSQVADSLLELQKWLHSHARDIMDESDAVLDTRSQLVFTIGRQQHMEGPERWVIAEQVLGLVSRHASSLRMLYPSGVEYEPGAPGAFPHLRIFQADAGQKLISWIAQDVIAGLLPNIKFGQLHLHSGLRNALRDFISRENTSHRKIHLAKEHYGQTPLWGSLLLLRGLLAHGILLFAFRKRRWRVDYGLSLTRTLLAVPYRAKDVPAQRAEFGHPDVAIILTCLSYYYGGLSEVQLRHSFEILLKQHDPSSSYRAWVKGCSAVPDSLRTLSGVNFESAEQWKKSLFPLFSRNQSTIEFYLSRVVFPREAREFPSKLSGSGWDLAEKKEHLLTGFSGTNDGQYLLPLHITQHDPDHQQGTNAKVLSYLLQPENRECLSMAYKNGKRRTTREFLQVLVAQRPEIRVLLDVGAQMLDLQNHELAQAWLSIAPNTSAAVYFNDDDELMVCVRDGSIQLLQSSPFAQQLDQCVIYLDDAHTRGTDIKFPSGFRAAVTLGPGVTKDHLAQGCMRMRKLGNGHSVMFFAPLEVDRQIRSIGRKGKDISDAIDTMDILHWSILETWQSVQQWAPHWVEQGIDHTSRYDAWSSFCRAQLTPEGLADKWLHPEAKRLKDLYEQRVFSSAALVTIPDICQRCVDLGVLSLCSVDLDEEQERERELVYEVELTQEHQTGLMWRVLPATHSVHQDLIDLVQTGAVPKFSKFFSERSKAFNPVFDTLHATSAATDEAYVWSQSILATKDFEETVITSGKLDDYLRPVQWIVSANKGSTTILVILSPYEVNYLLPDIRSRRKVHLHIYTPRLLKSTIPCDDLSLYSVPTVPKGWTPPSPLMDQLNVFSGQLYLKDYETYLRLCHFLCVYTGDPQSKEGGEFDSDGFISPPKRRTHTQTKIAHTFQGSPLVAIRTLMDLRSKGIDFELTHMGKIVRGQPLSEADFNI